MKEYGSQLFSTMKSGWLWISAAPRGNKIHIYAKIVAVTDIFHAMTLDKFYRNAQSPYVVLEQIQLEAFGKLDPKIVQTFIQKVTALHSGTCVRLSNGTSGEIVLPIASIQPDRWYPFRRDH